MFIRRSIRIGSFFVIAGFGALAFAIAHQRHAYRVEHPQPVPLPPFANLCTDYAGLTHADIETASSDIVIKDAPLEYAKTKIGIVESNEQFQVEACCIDANGTDLKVGTHSGLEGYVAVQDIDPAYFLPGAKASMLGRIYLHDPPPDPSWVPTSKDMLEGGEQVEILRGPCHNEYQIRRLNPPGTILWLNYDDLRQVSEGHAPRAPASSGAERASMDQLPEAWTWWEILLAVMGGWLVFATVPEVVLWPYLLVRKLLILLGWIKKKEFFEADYSIPYGQFERTLDGFIYRFNQPPDRWFPIALLYKIFRDIKIEVTPDTINVNGAKLRREDFGGFYAGDGDRVAFLHYTYGLREYSVAGLWPRRRGEEVAAALNLYLRATKGGDGQETLRQNRSTDF